MTADGRTEGEYAPAARYAIEACRLEPVGLSERLVVGGWCYRAGQHSIVTLRLTIDGVPVRDIMCDRRRDDVAQAHDEATGGPTPLPLCGFVAELPLPPAAHAVRLETADTGDVLVERTVPDLRAGFLRYKVEAFALMQCGVSEALIVEGWCYALAHPDPVRVRLTIDGRTIDEYSCRRRRQDVYRLYGSDPGSESTALPRSGFLIRIDAPPTTGMLRLESPHHGVVLAERDLRELTAFRSLVEFFRVDAPPVEIGPPLLSFQGWVYQPRGARAGELATPDISPPAQVVLTADGTPLVTLDCGVERPDVAQAFRAFQLADGAAQARCGFRARLPLPAGERFALSRVGGRTLAERSRAELLAEAGLAAAPMFVSTPASRWYAHVDRNGLRAHVREILAGSALTRAPGPTIAVLIAVQQASEIEALADTVQSIDDQVYRRCAVGVAVPADLREHAERTIGTWRAKSRVELILAPGAALADAAASTPGDWLCVLSAGDRLEPHALFQVVRAQQREPADLIYADEDTLDAGGQRRAPAFKPDWSPVRLLSTNYIGRPAFVRRRAHDEAGGFAEGEHALWLQLPSTARVRHVPGILCHRASPAAEQPARVVSAHLARSRSDLVARAGPQGVVDLDGPDVGPVVDIVIPTHNRADLVGRCLRSLEKTTYGRYRITIVDDRSNDAATRLLLDDARRRGINVLRIDGADGFSFARLNNLAVAQTAGEVILLLNNDTEVRDPRWLSRMVALLTPGVGAVGARLLYPDGTTQHAGVLLRVNGLAPGHELAGWPSDVVSPGSLAEMAREVSAVTGACLLTRRDAWRAVGGLDERFIVSLNDIDYCLRLADRGLRTVYAGGAVLVHHESASRGRAQDPAELADFRARYADRIDCYTNRNVEEGVLVTPECTLDFEAFKPAPLRVGIAGAAWEARACRAALEWVGAARRIEIATTGPEVTLAAGVSGYRDVNEAVAAGRPVIWAHGGPVAAPGRHRGVPEGEEAAYRRALDAASAVVFGSVEARDQSRPWQSRENFMVNRLAVPKSNPAPQRRPGACRIAWIGEADADADPAFFVRAVHRLRAGPLFDASWSVWEQWPADDRWIRRAAAIDRWAGRRTRPIGSPAIAHAAAFDDIDVFVSTSTGWEDPRPLLHATARGAAILTPQACGVGERTAFGVNAWSYIAGDTVALASRLEVLIRDDSTRTALAGSSPGVFGCLWTFEQMAHRWADLLWAAWHVGPDQ
jgi:GT2 family glycosyltransferase